MRVPMVSSQVEELKSRMKSGASASMQRSASRPMESSASMSMWMGSSHLCAAEKFTLVSRGEK